MIDAAFELVDGYLIVNINFKGNYYPKDVILYAVSFYVQYAVLYRDLKEIMVEREFDVTRPLTCGC